MSRTVLGTWMIGIDIWDTEIEGKRGRRQSVDDQLSERSREKRSEIRRVSRLRKEEARISRTREAGEERRMARADRKNVGQVESRKSRSMVINTYMSQPVSGQK